MAPVKGGSIQKHDCMHRHNGVLPSCRAAIWPQAGQNWKVRKINYGKNPPLARQNLPKWASLQNKVLLLLQYQIKFADRINFLSFILRHSTAPYRILNFEFCLTTSWRNSRAVARVLETKVWDT